MRMGSEKERCADADRSTYRRVSKLSARPILGGSQSGSETSNTVSCRKKNQKKKQQGKTSWRTTPSGVRRTRSAFMGRVRTKRGQSGQGVQAGRGPICGKNLSRQETQKSEKECDAHTAQSAKSKTDAQCRKKGDGGLNASKIDGSTNRRRGKISKDAPTCGAETKHVDGV